MAVTQIDYYRKCLATNPKAFTSGVRSFCKYASSRDDKDDDQSLWSTVKPWLIALGLGYLGMRAGTAWGRLAERTKNPYGPIKGPISVFAKTLYETNHSGSKVYYPGQPGYNEALAAENERKGIVPGRKTIVPENPL